METKKINYAKQKQYGYTRHIEQVVNHNAEVLENALNRLEKLEEWVSEEKPIENEEFVQSEDMVREEAIDMVRKAFAGWEDEFGIGDDWSKEHKARDMAIKALEQGEKNESCKENPDLGEIMVEIGREEKWLMEAGYNAYNVGIAFENIRRTLRNLAVDTSPIK